MITINKISLFFLIIFFVLGCSSMHVIVDYDKMNDFSSYTKYKWIKQKKSDDYQSIYKNEINKKRFALAIETALKKKGFERTTEDDHQFSVVYHLRFDKKLDVSSYGYKYYPRTGYTERYIQTKVYLEGSIILDIIDRNEKLLVWRGAIEGVLHETDDAEKVINTTIKEILKDFPPKTKSKADKNG